MNHYNKGCQNNSVAFIFSTPGRLETTRPVSGKTGDNMDAILQILNAKKPDLFCSTCRYFYRITNASTNTMYAANNNGRTESSNSEILMQANLDRITRELQNIKYVVLCGKKACLLKDRLGPGHFGYIESCHFGNKGLNETYPNTRPELQEIGCSAERMNIRYRLCANAILDQIHGETVNVQNS